MCLPLFGQMAQRCLKNEKKCSGHCPLQKTTTLSTDLWIAMSACKCPALQGKLQFLSSIRCHEKAFARERCTGRIAKSEKPKKTGGKPKAKTRNNSPDRRYWACPKHSPLVSFQGFLGCAFPCRNVIFSRELCSGKTRQLGSTKKGEFVFKYPKK